MTIEDKIKEMLVEHGMWGDGAVAAMEMMKADKSNELMVHRWNDNIEDYPVSMLAILWMKARDIALEYIDANCPLAWFRPMFVRHIADGAGAVAVANKEEG